MKIIDVSEHNGTISWEKVKKVVDGAIIRVGYGDNTRSQDDKQAIANIKACKRLGIPFGLYIYSYGGIVSECAHINAVMNLAGIKVSDLKLPIYLDLEDDSIHNTDCKKLARLFFQTMTQKYRISRDYLGIYSSASWWKYKLNNDDELYKNMWVAQYYFKCEIGDYYLWQYSSTEKINGINGNVDVSSFGNDEETFLIGMNETSYNYNSLSKIHDNYKSKYEKIVSDVLAGKYGDGAVRKANLLKKGYDYEYVQDLINEMFRG